jgi:hypothetical protein
MRFTFMIQDLQIIIDFVKHQFAAVFCQNFPGICPIWPPIRLQPIDYVAVRLPRA